MALQQQQQQQTNKNIIFITQLQKWSYKCNTVIYLANNNKQCLCQSLWLTTITYVTLVYMQQGFI